MKDVFHNEIRVLFLKHYNEWCLYSYSYLKNMDEAEDLVQDVFVKILSINHKKEILNLKGYITAMVRNSSIKKIEKLNKLESFNEEDLVILSSNEHFLIETETKLKIRKALEALPEESKKVFDLCVIEGMKYENTADSLGISVNTVKYHLKKAFKTLRFSLRNLYSSLLIFL